MGDVPGFIGNCLMHLSPKLNPGPSPETSVKQKSSASSPN